MLSHPAIAAASSPSANGPSRGLVALESLGELFDASDRREGSEVIMYWNDLEKDIRYKPWSKSVQALLQQPAYPGQMPQLARNIVNVILALDLTRRESHAILADNIAQFVKRGVPVRFGLVPLIQEGSDHDLGWSTLFFLRRHRG